jgi:hypothetical protein
MADVEHRRRYSRSSQARCSNRHFGLGEKLTRNSSRWSSSGSVPGSAPDTVPARTSRRAASPSRAVSWRHRRRGREKAQPQGQHHQNTHEIPLLLTAYHRLQMAGAQASSGHAGQQKGRQTLRSPPFLLQFKGRSDVQRRRVDLEARSHGRGQGDALDVGALGAGRTWPLQSVHIGLHVGFEGFLGEGGLADAAVRDAGLLDAELDRAALGVLDRLRDVRVTVPTFGFGIRPRGPSTLPRRPTRAIMSGDAMTRSKSMKPPLIFSYRSSAPTMSAPAARASSALASTGEHGDARTSRPVPVGQVHDATDHAGRRDADRRPG